MKKKTAAQDFFILTVPRSGSTALVRILDNHPQVFCAGELFHSSKQIYHSEWHFPFWGKRKRSRFSRKMFSVVNYIKGYFSALHHIKKFYSKRNGKDIRGFKFMINHIKKFPTAWNYLCRNNFKMIVLIRKNSFREALSGLRARQIGVFHTREDFMLAEKKIKINAALLKERVDECENMKDRILHLSEGKRRIIIWYEDFENWQQVLDKLFEFLCIKKIDIQPDFIKTSADNWRNGVENCEEIENVLKDKYAHYLN